MCCVCIALEEHIRTTFMMIFTDLGWVGTRSLYSLLSRISLWHSYLTCICVCNSTCMFPNLCINNAVIVIVDNFVYYTKVWCLSVLILYTVLCFCNCHKKYVYILLGNSCWSFPSWRLTQWCYFCSWDDSYPVPKFNLTYDERTEYLWSMSL